VTDDSERVEDLLQYLKRAAFRLHCVQAASLVRRIESACRPSASSRTRLPGLSGASSEEFDSSSHHPHHSPIFFRDAEAWKFVPTEIIRVSCRYKPDGPFGSGAPAARRRGNVYVGHDPRRPHGCRQFAARQDLASDVDDDALTQARHATYSAQHSGRPAEHLQPTSSGRGPLHLPQGPAPRHHLRPHDLMQDAPISGASARGRTRSCTSPGTPRPRFWAASTSRLRNDAISSWKGRAALDHGDLFIAVELKSRIFSKTMNENAGAHRFAPARGGRVANTE